MKSRPPPPWGDGPASAQNGAAVTPERIRLREKLTLLHEEEQRLTALEDGQLRAEEQRREAGERLRAAEAALRDAHRDEPGRLAYAFVNNEVIERQSLAQAQALVEQRQREHDQAREIDSALATEIELAQRRLRQCRSNLHEALAAVVTAAPEFTALMDAHTAAWRRLRSVRVCLRDVVQRACQGYMPQPLESLIAAVETLEERVGYEVDQHLISAWRSALERLATDADAELPRDL
jgi:hypothetical protein